MAVRAWSTATPKWGTYLILLMLLFAIGWPIPAIAQPSQSIIPVGTETLLPAADTAAGESLFAVNCAACHANGGNIIRRGKNLKQKALVRNGYGEVDAIAQLITQGKGVMPAYADKLSEGEIGAIAQYVQQQAATGW